MSEITFETKFTTSQLSDSLVEHPRETVDLLTDWAMQLHGGQRDDFLDCLTNCGSQRARNGLKEICERIIERLDEQ